MADFKRPVFRHLRSAKVWLTRAEKSFEQDSKIRGELDLFLAQAELQHARETSLSRQTRRKYSLLPHALSLVLATAIAAAGFGAYWSLSERNVAAPIPLAAQGAKVAPATITAAGAVAPVQVEDQRPAAATATSRIPAEPPQPVQRRENTERPRPAEKENLLSPDEMQNIVRAAGKSLRGQ